MEKKIMKDKDGEGGCEDEWPETSRRVKPQ
jgi:hypothetical protein